MAPQAGGRLKPPGLDLTAPSRHFEANNHRKNRS